MYNIDKQFIQDFKNNLESHIEKFPESSDKFEQLNDEIDDILMQYDFNSVDAVESWKALPCSNFSSFQDYLFSIDPQHLENTNTISTRVKVMRAERKKAICLKCNCDLKSHDGELICPKCGYGENLKSSAPNTRSNLINTKHITKQMDAICGSKKMPANIVKLQSYITIWLTELHYIYEWLQYRDTLNNFIAKYEKITGTKISDVNEFFSRTIERIPENGLKFKTFKLFIDEFYMLMEFCKKRYLKQISNINNKTDDEKLAIIKDYLKHNTTIPKYGDTHDFDGVRYEIGLYFTELSLWIKHDENSVFNKIVKLFHSKNKNITEKMFKVPGLMFNFPEVYKISENVPKKYTYGQEYINLNNYIFNIQYVQISNSDKKEIENLIIDFNRYYKEENIKRTMSDKVNSPLFNCTILCIINYLPKFNKYKEIIRYLPDKSSSNSSTSVFINGIWVKYLIDNPEIVTKYTDEEQEDESNNFFIM